ncbi:response regulator [Acinetobacter johnsonii]|uniref:response regulator n=1 Tax=Acinetobacter johnsonii TaxID=40214 RepID=UPI00280D79DC|nr:response regulator [Acinetobacter johnsonii]MDQ8974673.1 response regulator [Acinetobacter johnsonii]
MKKQVVKNKNALGLKLWVKLLGYKIKDLAGQGFTARLEDRELMKQIKKSHHYVLVTDELGGNKAAYELGAEYEMHLCCPAISDESSQKLAEIVANQIMKVA